MKSSMMIGNGKEGSPANHYATWTEEEVNFLRQNFKTMKHEDLAAALGRSRYSVGSMLKRLGLRRWIRGESQRLRFWKYVSRAGQNDCWSWKGCVDKNGYGTLTVKYRTAKAHRLSWRLHYGPIPNGAFICHKCDNPSCVNPQHLFLGNAKTNAVDMVMKGRNNPPRGEAHPGAKLTDVQVFEIRAKRESGVSCRELSREYGVHLRHVYRIINKKRRA